MIETPSIRVYRTHIEVYPYKEGQCPSIEKLLSRWDYICHKYVRIAYHIENDTLYIPKGVSLGYLSKLFGTDPLVSDKFDPMKKMEPCKPLKEAKSEIQQEAMDFLLSRGKFERNKREPQLSLNID